MAETDSHEWWKRYQETVNADPEMSVRGRDRFNTNFYVQIGEEKFLIEMHGGEVMSVVPNPNLNAEYSFSVEGSREAWEEFVQELPPAHNNEIIAPTIGRLSGVKTVISNSLETAKTFSRTYVHSSAR